MTYSSTGFPFHPGLGSKVRPVSVVLDSGDGDFAGVPITSRVRGSEFDLVISDLPSAGLNVLSVGRLHKPGVLSKAVILRHLGRLSEKDMVEFLDLLCRAYCLQRQT